MPAYSDPMEFREGFDTDPVKKSFPSKMPQWEVTEDIVISGIAGRFPEADSVEEFKQKLFDGVDLVTEDARRWEPGLNGIPKRHGKVKDITKLDAAYFGVSAEQADKMNPESRMFLEVVYEAIFDAGYSAESLRGKNIAVFVGHCFSETESVLAEEIENVKGLVATGCSRSMVANRVSYAFDFKGPSLSLDTACSSSIYALQLALLCMRSNQCEAAIVGGVNITIKPNNALQFPKLGFVNADGKCKSFDISADGYVRSETVSALLLQRAKDARRVYATVVHAKSNIDGFKVEGILSPSNVVQRRLLEDVYNEANIPPKDIAYLETHGTGTKVGDPEELKSSTDFFCNGRTGPLPIGSVKSNMGHSEAGAGMCSLAKVIIAFENELIPPNLHFKKPNPALEGLLDGRLMVVTNPCAIKSDSLVGLNSFGFGGANAHIILKGNPKTNAQEGKDTTIPRLALCCGRTSESVAYILDEITTKNYSNEALVLLEEASKAPTKGMPYRGYVLLKNSGDELSRLVDEAPEVKKPVWFLFSGMGSQWPRAAKDMMKIESFSKSILKSAEVLKPYNIDLIHILNHATEEDLKQAVVSFVAITSVQVALVDVLWDLGLHPDGIIGHSAGELVCAYADGCYTAEDIVVTAYLRGKGCEEPGLIKGGMAAVGLTWEEAKRRCPEGVYASCHNAEDSVSISGPADKVKEFVKELQSEDIFAKEIDSSGMAFHSPHIEPMLEKLTKSLEMESFKIKPRSNRWISTSVPEADWNQPWVKIPAAKYSVNNMRSPVYFYEGMAHVPKNAIVIEIAPHGLLQAIVKKCLGSDCSHVSLMKRNHPNNLEFFLSSIGKLYNLGLNPMVKKLYAPVSYPVSRGTPSLSHLVKWDHSQSWRVVSADEFQNATKTLDVSYTIDVFDQDSSDNFITGSIIDGRLMYPVGGLLMLAWKAFAKKKLCFYHELPVVFENITIHRMTPVPKDTKLCFNVSIMEKSGEFEITESGSRVATGQICEDNNLKLNLIQYISKCPLRKEDTFVLTQQDFYKEMHLRGLEYGTELQSVTEAEANGLTGKLNWNGNWIVFMEAIIQFPILSINYRQPNLPRRLRTIRIDPRKQPFTKSTSDVLPIYYDAYINACASGGVEIEGIHFNTAHLGLKSQPLLQQYKFVSNSDDNVPKKVEKQHIENVLSNAMLNETSLRTSLELAIENLPQRNLRILEAVANQSISSRVLHYLKTYHSNIQSKYTIGQIEGEANLDEDIADEGVTKTVLKLGSNLKAVETYDLVLGKNICGTVDPVMALQTLSEAMDDNGFLLLLEKTSLTPSEALLSKKNPKLSKVINETEIEKIFTTLGLKMVAKKSDGFTSTLYLLSKVKTIPHLQNPTVMKLAIHNYDEWVEQLKRVMKKLGTLKDEERLWLIVDQPTTGVVELVNYLRQEDRGRNVRCLLNANMNSVDNIPEFDPSNKAFSALIAKDLVMNIYRDGQWGTFRHIILEESKESATVQTQHAYLNVQTPGDLSSLRWVEHPNKYYNPGKAANGQVLCHVYYSAINSRDVLEASGRISSEALPSCLATQNSTLGLEFAGRETGEKGRRVMGIVQSNALATTVVTDPTFLWDVPKKWTLEGACTVPLAYATAYYALIIKGKVKKGERVLIHSGCDGEGQAAIAICLSIGCQVFTTVNTTEQREFLKKRFPQLTNNHFSDSNDIYFEYDIKNKTNSEGVDVVFNSLTEEKLEASISCVAKNGRFLEIGKIDFSDNNILTMGCFLSNISFFAASLDTLFGSDSGVRATQKEIVQLVNEGIKNGVVQPLQRTVFWLDKVGDAFQYMANGKHIGKVVIKIREDDSMKLFSAIPKSLCHPEKCYVVVEGLDVFGLELGNWLVERGCRNLVITSKKSPRTGYQNLCLKRWRALGVTVSVSTKDISTKAEAESLMTESMKYGTIGGVFVVSLVRKDDYTTAKVKTTENLDFTTRKLCPDLEWFVVLAGRGNAGQLSYGFEKSVMERLCEQRRKDGLPGLAIQWGSVAGLGVKGNDAVLGGTPPKTIASCVSAIEHLLQLSRLRDDDKDFVVFSAQTSEEISAKGEKN